MKLHSKSRWPLVYNMMDTLNLYYRDQVTKWTPSTDNSDLDMYRLNRYVYLGENECVGTAYVSNIVAQHSVIKYANTFRPMQRDGDDLMAIYVVAVLFNIGIQIWINCTNCKNSTDIRPEMLVYRNEHQGGDLSFPILNILYTPSTHYLCNVSLLYGHFCILTHHRQMFTPPNTFNLRLDVRTVPSRWRWHSTQNIYTIYDYEDDEAMRVCDNFYALRGITNLNDWRRLCVRKRTHKRIEQYEADSSQRDLLEQRLREFNSNSNLPLSFMTDFQPI